MRTRFFLPLAALAMAAGCACKGAAGALPAPHAGASVHVTAADNGKTVAVAVGSSFAVELVGVPTAGYLWKPSSTPDFLKETGTTGGPTTKAQKQPGFAGGNHWEVTTFVVQRAGTGVLKFEQRRPWETNQPAADTFSVTIQAK
ncbi:MAG TPA: protease inhibitor I42 family protein [Caulobacterales bacterium]|jgi:predicted secreted protein|nr:protease inhibitor I42 family protein [Caulobacterales bacterium]